MTSYQNAAATKMLATRCACCGRKLVDAVSVETGVGPDCRAMHGYDEAQGDPDWTAVAAALAPTALGLAGILTPSLTSVEVLDAVWRLGGVHTREAANAIVHRIAFEQKGKDVDAYTVALEKLGYTKLAARIANRTARVTVKREGDILIVKAPYCAEASGAWYALGDRQASRGRPGDHRPELPAGSSRAHRGARHLRSRSESRKKDRWQPGVRMRV